jgi:hypothetical protein
MGSASGHGFVVL